MECRADPACCCCAEAAGTQSAAPLLKPLPAATALLHLFACASALLQGCLALAHNGLQARSCRVLPPAWLLPACLPAGLLSVFLPAVCLSACHGLLSVCRTCSLPLSAGRMSSSVWPRDTTTSCALGALKLP